MRRRLLIVIIVFAILLSGCAGRAAPKPGPDAPAHTQPAALLSGDSEKTNTHVVSYDGHLVPVTVYRPIEASAASPVPVILHSHGWAGSRTSGDDQFRDFHRAGFGVVSVDMRGHGEARRTSQAQIHHMDYEIKDVREVISFLAALDWVRKDAPGDPIVGAIGGSYGGGYQLLTAATDPRLDAIAPEITWSSLMESLAPNGAVKSAWVDLLYFSGNANARLHPNIHNGFAVAQTQNRIPDGSIPGEHDLASQLRRSSPSEYAGRIQVPTLLIQGVNDTLFNLNQAIENYEMIRASGADVRLVSHLGGHILNTRGTLPVPAPQPVGLQPPAGGSPCGNLRNLTIQFHQVHLLGIRSDLGPEVCLALEDASTATGRAFPLRQARDSSFSLGASAEITQLVPRSAASLKVLTAQEPTKLAGTPVLRANVTTTGPAILYYSLQATRGDAVRTLHAQVTPFRHAESGAVEFEMGAIGAHLQPVETLELRIASHDDQFAHNFGRTPARTTLTDIRLELPILAKA